MLRWDWQGSHLESLSCSPLDPDIHVGVRVGEPDPPLAQTFLPGHRIRISVAGSNWPRYERNSHTGGDRFDPEKAIPANITLHMGGDAEASLALPVRPTV